MRELVVVVVVSLTKSQEGGDDGVKGGVLLGERLLTEVMSDRVDAKRCLVHEEHASKAGVDKGAPEIIESKVSNGAREHKRKGDGNREVVLMLPHDHLVLVKVGNINSSRLPSLLLENHPSDVREPEALVDCIWVLIGIDVPVMRPVVPGPPSSGSLISCGSKEQEQKLDSPMRLERAMGPQSMVSHGDTQSCQQILNDG
mmetsp:Transcript_22158/g.38305  ORF Transcript_22158/g.38305 Transcript_22158/m.38305 type:complete len:200 (-) Transcript_22158:586-1185(-)